MAELASYNGIIPRTVICGSTAIPRGARCTLQSTGVVNITADQTTRGDYVVIDDNGLVANTAGAIASMSGGGSVPALFDAAIAVGALVYAASSANPGYFSGSSASSALVVGRCTLAASAAGVLGQVELFSVA
jgi:hypothetical protein